MASPIISDFFGPGATVLTASGSVTASSSDPALVIKFSDFASLGWGTPSGATDPEKWITAIILKLRAYTAAATTEESNIVVQAPFLGLTTRNSVQKREYSYTLQIYEPDTGAANPDPDNV